MTQYNIELIKYLKLSELEAFKLNSTFVGTEHFILAILSNKNKISSLLNDYNITYNRFRSELLKLNDHNKYITYTPLFKKILFDNYNIDDVMISIIECGEGIGLSILNKFNIDISELYKNIKSDEISYGINLNKLNNNLIGRDKEINEIIEILLRKNKCNPLLIGEAGVGKTAIVEGLANRIENKNVPKQLFNHEIISISMSSLISGTRYRGEFEEKLEKIIKYITKKKNIIVFIDEIHTLVGAGGAEGAIDASNILKPNLDRNDIKLIGSTTKDEYFNSIYKDSALDRRFTKVIINEPNNKELKNILLGIKKDYEKYHNIKINNIVLDYIINNSFKYSNKKEPDRSIEILDTACSKVNLYSNNYDEFNIIQDKINNHIKNKEYDKANILKIEQLKKKKNYNKYKPSITNKIVDEVINCKIENKHVGFV